LWDFLSERYPSEKSDINGQFSPSMTDAIVKQLWSYMEGVSNDHRFEAFTDKIENFVNQEEERQHKLHFELYDTMNCDTITDASLFKFMEIMTI
jgi:hypothetical protein